MPEAKLWWNGSSWVTSDTTCANKTSKSSEAGSRPGIRATIKLVAYDNGKVKLYASLVPDGVSGSGNALGGTFTISFAGTTITVTDGSSRTGETRYTWSGELSTPTGTISYNTGAQNIYCVYYIDGAKYCNPLSFNGSVTVDTTPFCTVSYNANGGSGAPSAQTVCKGVDATLSDAVPTRSNHTFLGWATSSDAHTAEYSAGGSINISADTVLYAVWGPAVFVEADEGTTVQLNGVSYTNETAVVQNLVWGNSYPILTKANAGFIVKEQSHPDGLLTIEADETNVSAEGQRVGCHIDDGTQYVQAVMYLDTGTDWQMVQAYYDDGTDWKLVY